MYFVSTTLVLSFLVACNDDGSSENTDILSMSLVDDTETFESMGFDAVEVQQAFDAALRHRLEIEERNALSSSDMDADGVLDSDDNCTLVANPDQTDTDLDSYGNACDGDFDQDGMVTPYDWADFMIPAYVSAVDNGEGTDMDGSGWVDGIDVFDYFLPQFTYGYPGPSGLDVDDDGVPNVEDNCIDIENSDQTDTDSDGYGNACDGDFDQDGSVSAYDFYLYLLPDYMTGTDGGEGTDMDGSGWVDGIDVFDYFLPQFLYGYPGPSALN